MTEEILQAIDQKLGAIVRLLASGFIKEKNQKESIEALGALGLDRNLIAQIVGTDPKVVSTRLSEAKKKGRSRSKKPKVEGVS